MDLNEMIQNEKKRQHDGSTMALVNVEASTFNTLELKGVTCDKRDDDDSNKTVVSDMTIEQDSERNAHSNARNNLASLGGIYELCVAVTQGAFTLHRGCDVYLYIDAAGWDVG